MMGIAKKKITAAPNTMMSFAVFIVESDGVEKGNNPEVKINSVNTDKTDKPEASTPESNILFDLIYDPRYNWNFSFNS